MAHNLFQIDEVDLVYRTTIDPADRIRIESSKHTYQILKEVFNPDTINLLEETKLILVNRSMRILGIYNLSKGGINSSLIDSRIVFVTALKAAAVGIILAHNHPTGNTQPSPADLKVTRRLSQAGKLLGIKLIDHMIITSSDYYSFAEHNLLK
jgi:DNA repair protein RadC